MVFSYLTESNLGDKYEAAKKYTELNTKPYPEFERIANNQPSDQRDPRYSDVTDGTTSATVRKRGKRVVQQLPTGKVESDNDEDWLPIVAGFVFTNKILPYANLDFDLIQKCWQVIENGEKFGGVPTYAPFVNHDGYFCSDLSIPYWADVFLPEGYKSGNSAPYQFIRTWWQEDDVDEQIAQEKRLKKEAKARGEEYESTWDLDALKGVKKSLSRKESDEQTPQERERDLNPEGIEIVTGLQVGVGATFYTFCPTDDDDGNESGVTILRRKKNKDPRGKMPVIWYYADHDGTNPFGRGTVELVGPLQNLIDSDMQMYQWNRALMLAPPINVYGSGSKKISYAPNAINRMTDPNGKIEPMNVDTSAVVNYPDLYGLQKSQLLNLVSSPDTSISAEVGNPGFGKTPAALNQQQASISVDDNYVRKNFEAWFETWAETAINIYFAERTGKETLQLDKETVAELSKLAEKGKFDMNLINENNEILIDYDTATPALKFRVDASTSKMKDDVTQGDILTQLLATLESSPILSQTVPPEKVLAAWNAIIANSGVENPEDLKIDIEEFIQQQEMAAQQQMEAEAAVQQQAMQQGAIEGEVVEQPQAQLSPEDTEIVAMLQEIGAPDELIAQALPLLDDPNYTADDILAAVTAEMGVA